MIRINFPAPEKCSDCPFYTNIGYGKCKLENISFKKEDKDYIRVKRPRWCQILSEDIEPKCIQLTKEPGDVRYSCGRCNMTFGPILPNYCWYCGAKVKR